MMNSKAGETWRSQENEDEELQYGPGIVNKLKTRYLSRTLREKNAGEPRRPSLRRAASLENWLDKDGPPQKDKIEVRSSETKPARPSSFNATSLNVEIKRRTSVNDTINSPVVASPVVTSLVVTSPKDDSKKPDHLLLSKETIIIVEKGSKPDVKSPPVESKPAPLRVTRRSLPANTRYNVEDPELPPPDTVRQVKRLFESNCPRPSRRSQSAGPGYRVPLPAESDNKKRTSSAMQNGRPVVVPPPPTNRKVVKQSSIALEDKPVIITKPLLSPKPALTPKPNIPLNRRPVRTSLSETRKISINSSNNSLASTPTTPPIISPVVSPPILSRADEVKTKSLMKEEETDETDNGSKTVSKTALENIRKESVSVNFRFDKKDEKVVVPQSKQVGVIRPQVKTEKEPVKTVKKTVAKESNNVQQPPAVQTVAKETVTIIQAAEPQKIDVKSIEKEVQVVKKPAQGINGKQVDVKIEGKQVPSVDAVNSHVKSPDAGPKEAAPKAARNAKSWHNESTTTVFNFINSPKKVDYIKNESGPTTIHLYKPNDSGITKLPDFDGGESSDFIDDMDILKRPPSPCNVHFEGANVIHQKSVLQRRSRGVKLNISFNDDMTRLFEYPSEASLLEDDSSVKSPGSDEYLLSREPSLEKVTTGGLSSYTPSKVLIENTFKLGISSSVDALPQSCASNEKTDSMTNNVDETEYLRPADQGTTWSSETTSDLLF